MYSILKICTFFNVFYFSVRKQQNTVCQYCLVNTAIKYKQTELEVVSTAEPLQNRQHAQNP